MNERDSRPDSSAPAPSDPGQSEQDASDAAFDKEAARYQRQGLLGQGGMGRVYAARDVRLRRQVALKVAATPELAGRLAREAWITAQLEHPGIVAVYDAGETDGQTWYTMRLIRGLTLRERLGGCEGLSGRLALLPHLHAACQAVAYAHSMGIVHRDLKPSNIMVGEFGETQVADWGLACPVDAAMADWRRLVSSAGPPAPGAGTPRYMSPEQARGEPGGRASDVFCLGAALYEMLSGKTPPDEAGVPPDLGAMPSEVPRELVAIVRQCLQIDPSARYPTAAELAADLERWLAGRRVLAHEYEPSELLGRLLRAWRAPITVGGFAAIVLLIVVALAVERSARERLAAEANLAVALTEQALAALADERLPEAHVLAANALKFGPSARARGVLVATSHSNAELVWQLPLPERCQHSGVVAPDAARLACRGEGKLEIWALHPLVREISLDLEVVEAPVWVGDRLLVATPSNLVWIEGGVVRGSTPSEGWGPLTDNEVAFAVRGSLARSLRPDGGSVEFPICASTRPTTVVAAGELVVGCDDGQLRSYGPDGQLLWSLPLDERPAWSTVRGWAAGLLVGRLDGGVQALSLPERRWGQRLPGSPRAVRGLQPVPGTSLVLALGELGGPRVWNTSADAWAGSLPARATRMFGGAGDGEVLLLGESLQLWRVADTPRPSEFHFETGISQVVFSPSAEELAVALGRGDVVERRLDDGRESRRWRWADGVAKCVAYGNNRLLLGAAMGEPAQILGPASETRPVDSAHHLRRAGRLNDGRLWALSYGDAAFLVDPADGSVRSQPVGRGAFDGSSSPNGGSAAILDVRGGVWLLERDTWREVSQVTDAIAVDVGDGGTPLVVARSRDVCVAARCAEIGDDIVDIAWSGAHVAVGTKSGEVWLLDEDVREVLAVLPGHTGRVSSVEFAPDGLSLVSGSWDGMARVWDLREIAMPAEALIERSQRAWGLGLDEALRSR